MKKCVVIFLDLLGFKCFTGKDPDAALGMLEDFNSVRSMWRQIGRMENPLCAPQGLGNPAPQLTSVESFNCFIPMSDVEFSYRVLLSSRVGIWQFKSSQCA